MSDSESNDDESPEANRVASGTGDTPRQPDAVTVKIFGDMEPMNVANYTALAELGRGGMASVLVAVARGPRGFNKLVVLKTIRPELAHHEFLRASFFEEAKLAAQMNHPHVVQTNEVIENAGRPVMVMEYLDGLSLAAIADAHAKPSLMFPLRLRLEVLRQALLGLHYAHELRGLHGGLLQIVHRDVSPQNIFVTFDGIAKVIDFGIAKAVNAPDSTEAGAIKGKIRYMAPEQILGEKVDRRTDLFAVGVMLWEAASGTQVWAGKSDGFILNTVIDQGLPAIRTPVEGVPPTLLPLIARVTARKASDRPENALAVANELDAIVRELGAPPPSRELAEFMVTRFGERRKTFRETIESAIARLADQPALEAPLPAVINASTLPAPGSRRWLWWVGIAVAVCALVAIGFVRNHLAGDNTRAMSSALASRTAGASHTAPAAASADLTPATCARPTLLFDFENGIAESCATSWRRGGPFVSYFDGTGVVDPPPGIVRAASLLPEPRGASRSALHWHAENLATWGAGLAAPLNFQKPVDISRFRAISLWVRADRPTPLRFGIAIPTTQPTSYGGQCEATSQSRCGDHFSVRRVVSSLWTEVQVQFTDLRQEGWGKPAIWDATNALEIHIDAYHRDVLPVKPSSLSVDVWIDDAEFL